jgi:hypothetical protein
MRNYPVTLISAVNTATVTGSSQWVGQAAAASVTVVNGDATAGGTVKLQGSNEIPTSNYAQYVPSSASFCDIPNATSLVASGIGPAIVLPTLNFQYIRAVYTRTGGGSSTILVNASLLQV